MIEAKKDRNGNPIIIIRCDQVPEVKLTAFSGSFPATVYQELAQRSKEEAFGCRVLVKITEEKGTRSVSDMAFDGRDASVREAALRFDVLAKAPAIDHSEEPYQIPEHSVLHLGQTWAEANRGDVTTLELITEIYNQGSSEAGETAKRLEQQDEQQRLCEEAARYRAWEDWAFWDAMNRPPARKRRMEIQVLHGGGSGQSSSSCSTARCSLEGWDGLGELRVNLRILPGGSRQALPTGSDDREQESEASTVLVGGGRDHQRGDQREVATTVADTGGEDGQEDSEGGGAIHGASPAQDTVPIVAEGNTLNDIELAAIDAYAEQLRVEYDELERRVQSPE